MLVGAAVGSPRPLFAVWDLGVIIKMGGGSNACGDGGGWLAASNLPGKPRDRLRRAGPTSPLTTRRDQPAPSKRNGLDQMTRPRNRKHMPTTGGARRR